MDVIITLTSNFAIADGVAPDKTRMRTEFPYFGPVFTAQEQVGIRRSLNPLRRLRAARERTRKEGGAALALAHLGRGGLVFRSRQVRRTGQTCAFPADGSATRPIGWREWVHVGTRYKPIGVNILDQKLTETPEILNAYVEPSAMAVYERTGLWPEGAQIIKEFTAVQVGAGCDTTTFVCSTEFGEGIYESGFIGLGFMVKDSMRFPGQPRSLGILQLWPPAAALFPDCAADDHVHRVPCEARQ